MSQNKPLKVLITGITGPVGSFLADYLVTLPDVEVHGFKRWRSDPRPIQQLYGTVIFHEGDIVDPFIVNKTIAAVKPDFIYHLAAQSYPAVSWDAPIETLRTNVEGTINVLEAARLHVPEAKIHVAGSSAEYGWVKPEEVPIKESRNLRPASPYGVSKVAQELTALQYHDSYGQHVYVTRFFNQVGPRQGDRCSIQTFCQQMAMIEAGLQEPKIKVGNLEAKRDFSHVLDTARALWLLLNKGKAGKTYNVCSGVATRIGDIADIVLAKGKVKAELEIDPSRLRPLDEPILQGDNSELKQDTGWEPEVTMEQIVEELLEYWRNRIAEEHRLK